MNHSAIVRECYIISELSIAVIRDAIKSLMRFNTFTINQQVKFNTQTVKFSCHGWIFRWCQLHTRCTRKLVQRSWSCWTRRLSHGWRAPPISGKKRIFAACTGADVHWMQRTTGSVRAALVWSQQKTQPVAFFSVTQSLGPQQRSRTNERVCSLKLPSPILPSRSFGSRDRVPPLSFSYHW